MIVTVFGGSGFVGSRIVQRLARDGARVRVAVRRPERVEAGDRIEAVRDPREGNVQRGRIDRDADVGALGPQRGGGVLEQPRVEGQGAQRGRSIR